MTINQEWKSAEKKTDPNFTGSIFEQLGFDAELCPTCNAHLKSGICLNACHLSDNSQKVFNTLASLIATK